MHAETGDDPGLVAAGFGVVEIEVEEDRLEIEAGEDGDGLKPGREALNGDDVVSIVMALPAVESDKAIAHGLLGVGLGFVKVDGRQGIVDSSFTEQVHDVVDGLGVGEDGGGVLLGFGGSGDSKPGGEKGKHEGRNKNRGSWMHWTSRMNFD
jgi:hypothetical protein